MVLNKQIMNGICFLRMSQTSLKKLRFLTAKSKDSSMLVYEEMILNTNWRLGSVISLKVGNQKTGLQVNLSVVYLL